jgi:hypothetical protein
MESRRKNNLKRSIQKGGIYNCILVNQIHVVRFFSMKRFWALSGIISLMAILFSGCAGNGAGLDENGNPIGSGGGGLPVAFEPTFSNIQQNVFSAICIECHIGAAAPEGLRLDAQNSYANLVNVRSVEQSNLFRVNPGNPNDSYIIHKLEGGPNITGGQMPLNRPPLQQNTINAIRVWIAQGAPNN